MSSDSAILGGFSRDGKSLAACLLRRLLPEIRFGHLTIVLPSSERIEHRGTGPGGSATLVLHRWRAS